MMFHNYSVDDLHNIDERYRVLYKLAFSAGIIVGVVGFLLAWVNRDLIEQHGGGPLALSAPAAVGVYWYLVKLVEHKLWKKKFVRLLLGISLPVISGQYEGKIQTRNRNGDPIPGEFSGRMYISQTWSTMLIQFETDNIISHSTGAFMSLGGHSVTLTLEYQVVLLFQQNDNSPIQAHTGTSTMRFMMDGGKCDLANVKATYYTSHRETGMINLKRVGPLVAY